MMNRVIINRLTKTAAGLGAMLLAGSTFAQVEYDYAPVVDVRPVVRVVEVSTPQEQCWEEEYLVDSGYYRNNSGTPPLVGAIIGGAIGNAVGHGKSNKRVGAVVGAILGHSIGRDIMRQHQGPYGREVETVQRCETVYQSHEEERIVGYNVTYNYNGQDYTVRTDSDPGDQIRVRVSVQPVL